MNITRRLNRFWIGLAAGTLLPSALVLIMYLLGHLNTPFDRLLDSVVTAKAHPRMLTNILIMCIVPNFAIFYFFLNREFWNTSRGIVAATVLCAAIVAIIRFTV